MCSGWFSVYVRLTSAIGHNLCYPVTAFDLTCVSIDPNVSNILLNSIHWQCMGLRSQSYAQEIKKINVIKDLKVSTGATQMLVCSHTADKVLRQHPLCCFYKNVFLGSELLVIVFSADSTGKEWHIYYKSAHGAGFLLRGRLFIEQELAGLTGNFSHLFKW